MMDFVSDYELLDDDISIRGCRYKYEIPSEPFHNYSVSRYFQIRIHVFSQGFKSVTNMHFESLPSILLHTKFSYFFM